jgi:Rrf2 family transcriptional regulator, nitric oxide-sensitive transcriptional repressor
MISQTAEYALRAIVFLAVDEHNAQVTQEIARRTHVPAGYLSKVLQSLSRAGLVTSQRGLGGGFALAKPPKEITIYEVIQAVDPVQRIRACPLKLVAHNVHLCPLHKRLDQAMALVEKSFRESTVAKMLTTPGKSRPLCTEPPKRKKSNRR